jgi:hypothetical protein
MEEVKHAFVKRKWRLTLFIFIVLCLFLGASWQDQEKQNEHECVNWDVVKQALDVYESCPSEENAKLLLATVPEKLAARQLGRREAVGFVLIESGPFKKALITGDALLAETAFRMFGYMRGGVVEEELRIMLGRFLTKNPVIFLKLLKKYLHLFASERDYPVTMTEILDIVPDITSKEDSRRMKTEGIRLYTERIKALERVEDPGLMELRDACIRVIKAIINEL